MPITTRPSKTFLFNTLESRLKTLKSGRGLDAASAGFKNRKMFQTDNYYGLDIDLPAIKKGLTKHNNSNTFGILADINNLNKLSADFFNVVVSTNTLDHLDNKISALKQLIRLVSTNDGILFCHFTLGDDFNNLLKTTRDNFDSVEIIYLRNPISRVYERFFETDDESGFHKRASSKPFLLLSWVLSRLEYLTRYFRNINQQVILVCSIKGGNRNINQTQLTLGLPQIEKKIYTAI